MSKKSKSFVSMVGEFGLMLKQISSVRANPNQIGLRRVMLELYNKSGKQDSYKPIIYSDREKNTEAIPSPAFTILGESTPERFYETLTDEMIYEGLLPRFTIIEYQGKRPKLNKGHLTAQMPDRLVEQFSQLCAYALQLNNGNTVINVNQSPEATEIFENFNLRCDQNLNLAHNEITRHLWNRAHVKTLKLAAVLAIGTNYINPVVSNDQALWAINLIENDINNLLRRFENGEIGKPQVQNEQAEDIQKAFKKYLKSDWSEVAKHPGSSQITHHNKVVPHGFITAYCRARTSFKNDRMGPVNAVKTQIQSLIEGGDIQEVSPSLKAEKMLPRNGKLYVVTEVKWLK